MSNEWIGKDITKEEAIRLCDYTWVYGVDANGEEFLIEAVDEIEDFSRWLVEKDFDIN